MPLVVPKVLTRSSKVAKYVCIFIFYIAVYILQNKFTKYVTTPFIDEIFHLRQCQTYCQGKFFKWDNKITTPPGLYLLGYAYVELLEFISNDAYLCSHYSVLRSLNLVGGVIVLPLIVSQFKTRRNEFWSVNIVAQPTLFTYYFLFYTDVWSTVLILGSLGLVVQKRQNTGMSAFIAFLSLWLRQTNIVWIAFILVVYIDNHTKSTNFLIRCVQFITQAFKRFTTIFPFILNFALFGIFLKINGGITFGDKENHKIGAHVVQIFYCFTFINFFTVPVWLSSASISRYLKFLIINNYGLNLILNLISFALIKFIIARFTIVHPFLLADNRHFTFYIYRRLLSNPQSWILAVPIYHFCTWNIIRMLIDSNKMSILIIVAYVVAVVLTLVPSPLFEPRYYIVPLIVFRLFVKPVGSSRRSSSSQLVHFMEFIWLNAINLFTMFVFFTLEFKWDSSPDSIQRIIW